MTFVWVAVAVIALWLLTGGSSGRGLRIRSRNTRRLKATLVPLRQEGATWMTTGWAIWEQQEGQDIGHFELQCSGFRNASGDNGVPAGAVLDIVVGGSPIGTAPIRNRRLRFEVELSAKSFDAGAEAAPGVEVRYQDRVLMLGELRGKKSKRG